MFDGKAVKKRYWRCQDNFSTNKKRA